MCYAIDPYFYNVSDNPAINESDDVALGKIGDFPYPTNPMNDRAIGYLLKGKVKNAVTIPVVANGDVTTLDDVTNILRLSKANGVMIGRGVYGKPWFLNQVIEFLKTGKRIPAPTLAEQYIILREHYIEMLNFYGKSGGLRIARKHMAWYSKGLPNSAEFRKTINKITEASNALNFIDQF